MNCVLSSNIGTRQIHILHNFSMNISYFKLIFNDFFASRLIFYYCKFEER